jgi:protein-L-isoaspartate(D-aspartate) O-methyltransferase
MLINAGVTHPNPLWLDRLREGGRLVLPLTIATSPHLGIGVMAKIVHEGNGFSAQIVTSVAIYSLHGHARPTTRSAVKRGDEKRRAAEDEIGTPRCSRIVGYVRRARC